MYGWRGLANSSRVRGVFDDAAQVHHRNARGDVLDHGKIVRDKNKRQAEPALQIGQKIDDLRLDRNVERRHRFVADDELRLGGECAGDANTLALAAGELMGVAFSMPGLKPDETQQLGDALTVPPLCEAMKYERLGQHLPDVHTRVE